ncbi:hypothetical protein [Myxococcus sp. CA039A]|uniref:hypothetical protein n=1 Tax=Myxococcus sp. CA039A TaxID=2741737 RepID=UPI00157A9014|nr:hypothetical protein [Myxococcus sp. CA039A]NTX55352.1 hypothetical protein [Myxococcus sp. CA039A]
MFIISGSSPKQQDLGEQRAPCPDCQQETSQRLQRHYRVIHVFWFPLFSLGTKYVRICGRCNLHTEVPEQQVGPVPVAPLLHRMGGLFPVAALAFCCVGFPLVNAVVSLGTGDSSGSSQQQEQRAGRQGFDQRFEAQAEDLAVETTIQSAFEEQGHQSVTVSASSASVKEHVIRVVSAQTPRLKKVSDGDRIRMLEMMEAEADKSFANEEVFLGLRGKLLWGGYSHRAPGGTWKRVVDGTTSSPMVDAFEALLQREAALPPSAPDAVPTPEPTAAPSVVDDTAR